MGIARRESELRGVNRNCARSCAEKSSARIIASWRWSSAGAQPGARLARWRWRWSQWLRYTWTAETASGAALPSAARSAISARDITSRCTGDSSTAPAPPSLATTLARVSASGPYTASANSAGAAACGTFETRSTWKPATALPSVAEIPRLKWGTAESAAVNAKSACDVIRAEKTCRWTSFSKPSACEFTHTRTAPSRGGGPAPAAIELSSARSETYGEPTSPRSTASTIRATQSFKVETRADCTVDPPGIGATAQFLATLAAEASPTK